MMYMEKQRMLRLASSTSLALKYTPCRPNGKSSDPRIREIGTSASRADLHTCARSFAKHTTSYSCKAFVLTLIDNRLCNKI
eukprot:2565229-Amphidinium_carterae.1